MKKTILLVLSVLLGLFLVNAGLNKFFNYMPMPDNMPEAIVKDSMAMMEIEWLMPLIAWAEIIGGLLLAIPKTRALGALVVFPVMVGILLTHIIVAPDGLLMAIIMWVVLLWIMIDNKDKYLMLVK
ncbi:DoxX family membrane protein [Terrimonas rubra]|uniref:DoxX family membrane protein n=1 Tax=Terrimonas rubra TaxID=1035890 RepID=A0ABW6ABH5_9BACT